MPSDMNRVRILPPDEWPRLLDVPGGCPFTDVQTLPDPIFATVLVEETESGEIVGTWMATAIVLLEALWRSPAAREVPSSGKRLLLGMVQHLREMEVKTAITVIQDPAVETLAETAGFVALPGGGKLFTLTLRES